MIDTANSKPDHYVKGSYSIGTGPEVVVILGSCRVLPYVNYFHYLNTDNRFTIHLINVVNFYYNATNEPTDVAAMCASFENNAELLATLKACKWFIHEHTENFGMFNTERNEIISEKNIYQFGMKPDVDVSIPNFNNTFILFQELVNYDEFARTNAQLDKTLTRGVQDYIKAKGLMAIDHFLKICALTSLPEFGALFGATWQTTRYFWTGNHVSNKFTRLVFALMNEKFLHIPVNGVFWDRIESEDMYATPCTPITQYDVDNYGLQWPQAVEGLVIP